MNITNQNIKKVLKFVENSEKMKMSLEEKIMEDISLIVSKNTKVHKLRKKARSGMIVSVCLFLIYLCVSIYENLSVEIPEINEVNIITSFSAIIATILLFILAETRQVFLNKNQLI